MESKIFSEIKYFEIEDGEKFCIIQLEDGQMTDEILMDREVAIELANIILSELN